MDAEGLKLKIDSKGAQQDLAALSKVLDKTAGSADKLDKAFARAAVSTDQNLSRAAKSMEKYAQVAALLSKIKVAGNPTGQIQELGKALDQIGRAKQINMQQVAAVKELGAALGSLRVTDRVLQVAGVLNTLGRARMPTAQQARNLREFFSAVESYKGTGSSEQLGRLLNTLSNIKAPSAATIGRIREMFVVLAGAKEMPGAGRIANQLDTIALAATRAGRALSTVQGGGARSLLSAGGATPRSPSGAGAGGGGVRAGAGALNKTLGEGEEAARKATGSFSLMGRGLDDLSGRFKLSYQMGTLFTTMFASFTAGQFIGALYSANIQLLKLQKAMLFATGTFDGANAATDKYISMSQELGLSIKDNIETYGRFSIAAKAANVTLDDTNKIYHAVGQAMTVVGASAQQQQLAFYGLTEMLQKGVVYSKEFNRQIGAQLPGNAILGARALSQLRGQVVSVAQFFQEMHKGTLLSPQFVPAWAKAVEDMYHPLLALAQARPDVALARLNNAFFIFARQIGQGSFMTAIGKSLTELLNKFTTTKDGVTSLTPAAAKLADTLGHGLATAIHTAGDALGFIVGHFDTLFTVMKGFLAFKLAGEFGAIASATAKATEKMFGFSAATRVAAASEAAVSTQSVVASIAAPTGKAAAVVADLAANTGGFGRRAAASTFQRGGSSLAAPRSFGNRLNLPLFNWADQNEASAASVRAPAGAARSYTGAELRQSLAARPNTGFWGSAVTGAASGLGKSVSGGFGAVFEKAASAMSLLGPAATAAAVGLAMFSDKAAGITTSKGNSENYGDVADGMLSTVGDSVKGFVADVGVSFGMFGSNALTLGKVVLSVGAVIKAVFSLMFDLAHALGTIIGGAIANLIVEIMTWGKVIGDVLGGHFADAAKDWKAGNDRENAIGVSTVKGVGNDLLKIGTSDSATSIYKQMSAAAAASADGRIGGQKQDDANKKQLEAALRQQNAAAIIEASAQKFAEASLGMGQLSHPIDPDKLMADIKAFASGKNVTAGMTGSEVAAAGPTANKDVVRIVGDAAKAAGINPQLLLNLGMSETHYDPSQYGFGKAGTSARGPFQLETGALSDLSKAGFDTSGNKPYNLETAAPLAAQYLKMQQATFSKITGRDLNPDEALLPYKLGGAGAAKLVNSITDPNVGNNTLAKDLFPSAANAKGNHSLFFASKDNSTPTTAMELYAKYIQMAGGSTPHLNGEDSDISALTPGGGGTGGATDTKIDNVADTSFKKVMSVIGEGDPAAAAVATLQEKLVSLSQTFKTMQGLAAKSPFAKTFLSDQSILAGIQHAMDELKKKEEQAADPIGNMIRLSKQENDVTEMRVKGLSSQADMQSEINKLVEQGYTPEKANELAQKNAAAFKMEQDRTALLTAQIDLQKQLNDLETKRMDRLSNSGLDNLVNAGVAGQAKPGETLSAARARLANSGQLGVIQQGARAQYGENVSASAQGLDEDINSMQQRVGNNPQQQQWQDNYISALQKLTGVNTDSLDRLNAAAADAAKATGMNIDDMAKRYAAMKTELENPPGFQKWVDGLEPMSKRMEDLKSQFAEGLSDNLTKALTGGKTDWTGMFKSLQEGMVKGQVDNLLGSLFKGLGLASPQSPQQAQMAAAQTFGTGADTFSTAVATFSTAVTGVTTAAGTATGAASALATGSTSGVGSISGLPVPNGLDTAIPALRGSLDTGASGAMALQNLVQAKDITPNVGAINATLPSITAMNPANDNSDPGFMGNLGKMVGWNDQKSTGDNIANLGLGALGLFGNLLFPGKKPDPTYHNPNGIIGAMSTNTVNGTYKPAQANPIGSILNFAAQSGINGNPGGATGAGGLLSSTGFFGNLFGGTGGGAGSLSSLLLSMFSEGGYSTSPVSKVMGGINMNSVPHYAEGTHNTSGIPAVLHPNEAVIPLSRGRKIPVEMNDNSAPASVTSNITVIAPNPDAFRKASGSIKRDQNRSLKRAATRNLTS